jgi:hypothetical protein
MKTISLCLLIVMSVGLAGCSTKRTMNEIMASWEGAAIEEVMDQWGAPQEVREFKTNNIYVWNHATARTKPKIRIRTLGISSNTGSSRSSTAGGGATHVNCQRLLEVNPQGQVVDGQWNGNGCPYREDGPYANWRRKAAGTD